MSTTQFVYQIPGPKGDTGTAGTSGTDGVNAFTTTTAQFAMPAEGANVTVAVDDGTWASVGQVVHVSTAGYFSVAATAAGSLTLTNLEVTATGAYASNAAPATVIAAGKQVAPAGVQGIAGTDGASGADADAYYVVTRAADAPANAVNLGLLTTGLVKNTVAAGVSTLSTAAAGTDYVAPDAELTALAGLASAADKVPYFTGSGTAALADFTAAGRALVDDASAAAQRATLSAAGSGANSDITSLTGLTTPLSVAQGGTAGATAAAARSGLGVTMATAGYIVVQEQQSAGTDGGTFTAGSWQVRALNTEVVDTGSHAAVAASQITLAAGTYRARFWAVAHEVNNHKCRLYNVTGAATLGVGSTGESAATDDTTNKSVGECRFTIAVDSVIQLQHRCETTKATDGYGEGVDFGEVEIYSAVILEREAG